MRRDSKDRAVDRAVFVHSLKPPSNRDPYRHAYDAEGKRNGQRQVSDSDMEQQISELGVSPLRVRH